MKAADLLGCVVQQIWDVAFRTTNGSPSKLFDALGRAPSRTAMQRHWSEDAGHVVRLKIGPLRHLAYPRDDVGIFWMGVW